MTFGSLFSGIGGIDLGLERAGMECRWQVEIDPFARRVLTKHWPNVPKYKDVRIVEAFDDESQRLIERVEPIDLLAGGFPCQDISTAGQGIGIIGERSGLWKEFARLVAELRPISILAENVPALRGRGLAMVLQDLWALGYDAEWHCIPACSFGAPHERDRIWIVAYPAGMFREAIIWGEPERTIRRVPEDANLESDGWRPGRARGLDTGYSWQRESALSDADFDAEHGNMGGYRASAVRGERSKTSDISGSEADSEQDANSDRERFNGGAATQEQLRQAQGREHSRGDAAHANSAGLEVGVGEPGDDGAEQPTAERSDSESSNAYSEPLVRAAIARGERHAWTVEPGVVRMVHGVSSRVDRLRGLGNAVVPQVVEWIGRRIIAAHSLIPK